MITRRSLRPRKSINYLDVVLNKSTSKSPLKNDENDEEVEELDEDFTINDSSSSEADFFFKSKNKRKSVATNNSSLIALLAADDEDDENEYKLQRQKNIGERLNVLKAMNVDDDINDLNSSSRTIHEIPEKKQKIYRPKTLPPPRKQPVRSSRLSISDRSLRSQKQNSEQVPSDNFSENVDNNLEVEEKELEENLNLHNFDEDKDFLERIKGALNVPYDEVSDFVSCDFDKYSETIRSCHMFDGPQKIIPTRITALDFHPSEKKLLLLSGDKNGHICLWDVSMRTGIVLQAHKYNTNCVSFSAEDGTKFYSTSLDGTTRIGDVNRSTVDLLYTTDGKNREEHHLTWHHELKHTLMISGGDGVLTLVDLRAPTENALVYKCHKRSIRTVQSHPTNDNYFLTSSGLGMFGIWDLRNMNSKNSKPIILQDLGKALTSAFYSMTGSYVLTTSNDDTIRIYDCRNDKPKVHVSIPHNNHGGRWLSVFKAKWQPQREDCFYVGSLLTKPKRIQAYKFNGKVLHEFSSPMMETYSPVLTIHPSKPIIVGGNGSGKIHVFSPFQNLNDI